MNLRITKIDGKVAVLSSREEGEGNQKDGAHRLDVLGVLRIGGNGGVSSFFLFQIFEYKNPSHQG